MGGRLLVLALAGAIVGGAAGSARAAPAGGAPPRAPAPRLSRPSAPGERIREIVSQIDAARGRAAAPGLRGDERDVLADLAWALADEALGDPLLRERARRDAGFLQAHALLLMDDGDDGEALAVLGRLQAIAPRDPETHRLVALALMGLGRAPEAADAYRRALEFGCAAAGEVRAHLAYALAAAGLRREALAESDRAIGEDPAGYLGHFVRGWILGELGRADEERAEYLAAVGIERDDADLWALLAESWEGAGEAERAREAWREVLRIDPSDEQAAAKLVEPGPPAPPERP